MHVTDREFTLTTYLGMHAFQSAYTHITYVYIHSSFAESSRANKDHTKQTQRHGHVSTSLAQCEAASYWTSKE